MQYATLALALATVAAAAPAPPAKEFHVLFDVSGNSAHPTFVSANLATANGGKAGRFVIKGERLSVYPGTPAYLSGGTVNKDLAFDTTKLFGAGKATAVAPYVGDAPGVAKPIEAIEGDNVHDLEWSISSKGEIYHLKSTAKNQFFSCTQKIGDTDYAVLSWGNPTADGKAPKGCTFTKVVKG